MDQPMLAYIHKHAFIKALKQSKKVEKDIFSISR